MRLAGTWWMCRSLVNKNLVYIGADQEVNSRSGFVMGDALLTLNRLNVESWQLGIELAGKPDVELHLSSFVQGRPEPGLRQRAGGILGELARNAEGLKTLRNRKRNFGRLRPMKSWSQARKTANAATPSNGKPQAKEIR
nr:MULTISPECIES: T6SS immunity protein Tli4 family protein [unclassified Neisseria]